jgi:hypothetical protein
VLLGMNSSVRGLFRRIIALGVLFGVLVAPAEMSIPDVHDRAAPHSISTHVAGQSSDIVGSATVVDDHSSDHGSDHGSDRGANHDSQRGSHNDPQDGSHNGYDHCTHSHVVNLVRSDPPRAAGVISHILYATISEQPSSFAAPPHIRPPIA